MRSCARWPRPAGWWSQRRLTGRGTVFRTTLQIWPGTPALFKAPYGEVIRQWAFERDGDRVDVNVDGWLVSDSRHALDAAVRGGQLVARVNDLTAHPGIDDGSLQPVLLDWTGLNSPPLSMIFRRSLARQPRMRAWVDFMAEQMELLTLRRKPAGLPPVRPALRPDWWQKRVSAAGQRGPG